MGSGGYVADGLSVGIDSTGFILSSMVVWCVTLKYCVMLRSFTVMHYIAIWLSILGFYLGLIVRAPRPQRLAQTASELSWRGLCCNSTNKTKQNKTWPMLSGSSAGNCVMVLAWTEV